MYLLANALFLLILPLASVLIELEAWHSPWGGGALVAKWFVFWAVGGRVFTAGLRQAIQPRFTARDIFAIQDPKALILVQELGFANLATGTLGIAALFKPSWVGPAALVGGLFYGLAGMRHLGKSGKNRLETTATVTDLYAFVVLAWAFLSRIMTTR